MESQKMSPSLSGTRLLSDISTLILESSQIFRRGILCALAGSRYEVIWDGASYDEFEQANLSVTGATIVIVGTEALPIARLLELLRPNVNCRIMFIAEQPSCDAIQDVMAGAAYGYVTRTISCEGLLKSLDLVLEGFSVLPSDPQQWHESTTPILREIELIHPLQASGATLDTQFDTLLSARERLFLERVAHGASNKQIANSLGITDATVKVHVKSLFRKTRMANRTLLALWAAGQQSRRASRQDVTGQLGTLPAIQGDSGLLLATQT
jgi:two-component system, NarL family, nitrate/nitrite response regulator NarL